MEMAIVTIVCRDMLADAIEDLGGYYSDIFDGEDTAEILSNIHNKLSGEKLNLETARSRLGCLKIAKVQELVVNENTSMRDLNIGVLMTHWDHISMVYFHR